MKLFLVNNWHYLLFAAIILLAAWSNHRHNRDAARKGENPRSFNITFGRNSFRKDPEPPYAEDRKINRNWKP
jgi:hypothetical protein